MFFNDDSFLLGNEIQMNLLEQRLREAVAVKGEASLLLFADKKVSNDTLSKVFLVLREAGIESVSLAVDQD